MTYTENIILISFPFFLSQKIRWTYLHTAMNIFNEMTWFGFVKFSKLFFENWFRKNNSQRLF